MAAGSSGLETLEDIRAAICELRKRVEPDQLARSVDVSYLSVNNLRAFLQILSLVMTIFIAAAVYFGSVGLTNIMKIQEEAKRAEALRSEIERAEGAVSEKAQRVDEVIPQLQAQLDSEAARLRATTGAQIDELSAKVERIARDLREVSQLFNAVAIANEGVLNAREQQLLVMLARHIDPSNATFRLNAAQLALLFRRYDEAIEHVEAVLKDQNLTGEIKRHAEALQAQARSLKAAPPDLKYEKPGAGAMVGPYGIVELPVNILHALINYGILTVPQAQEVIDASRGR